MASIHTYRHLFLALTVAVLAFPSVAFGDPRDGDVLLYLPLDGDMDTVACVSENAGSTITGTPVYDDEVWKLHLVEFGNPTNTVRSGANQGCLFADKTVVRKTITHPYMQTEDFKSATIEFFMKGSSVDADVATWENKLSLGNDNTKCGLMVQANNDKKWYLRVDTDASNAVGVSPFAMTDGKWHHFAIVIESIDDGTRTKMTWYFDYGNKIEATRNGTWAGFRYNQTFTFGAAKSVLWLDEFRITKGVLAPDKFIRFSSHPDPQDGDTLLYMTFDGTMDPIVGYNGSIGETAMTGTPTYDAAVWKPYVFEYGSGGVPVREGENLNSLKGNKAQVVKPILHPYMTDSNVLYSATIEFFMKGSSVDADVTTWRTKMSLGRNLALARYGLLVQADDNKRYYLRLDADTAGNPYSVSATSPFTMTDGRWHHFAIVVEPIENGTRTRATYYFDYGDPVVKTVDGTWFGMRRGNELTFGETTSVLWLDEFRVSKGVLPKSRFLKAKDIRGMIISFR